MLFAKSSIIALGLALSVGVAQAAAIPVPYTGDYDERVSAPSGDYDAIGGLEDVGEFSLLVGNNYFAGGIGTPSDSSDAFLIRIPAGLEVLGASIEWGTNANDFNPIFARPAPDWTLEESDATPTIFLQNLGGNGATAPLLINAPPFTRGEGIYSMVIGNGVFAMNNNDPIGYRMNFIVRQPSDVPEPATLALFGLGLAGLGAVRRRKLPA